MNDARRTRRLLAQAVQRKVSSDVEFSEVRRFWRNLA